jgi:WD40 repeat protein
MSRFLAVAVLATWASSPAVAQTPGKPRMDSLGDPLPEGAIARLGTLRLKHFPPTGATGIRRSVNPLFANLDKAVFSPDGKKIASLDHYGTIRMWDAANGKAMQGPWDSVDGIKYYDMAFSPDSATLAAGGLSDQEKRANLITLWDIATAKGLWVFDAPSRPLSPDMQSLAFNQTGKSIILAGPEVIRWLDVATGKEVRTWQEPNADRPAHDKADDKGMTKRRFYTLSPKANYLVVQTMTWEPVLAKNPPGNRFLEREAIGYDLAGGQVRWRVKNKFANSNMRFAFSANEKSVAITVEPDRVELRDTTTGEVLDGLSVRKGTQLVGTNTIGALAISPNDNTLAFSGSNSLIHLSTPNAPAQKPSFSTHIAQPQSAICRCLAFSPDGKRLLVALGWDLQLYDVATLKEAFAWEGHRGSVEQVAFASDWERMLTCSAQYKMNPREMATWIVGTSRCLEVSSLQTPRWPNVGVASPDHKLYVGAQGDDLYKLYDMSNGQALGQFPRPNKNQGGPLVHFFSMDGKYYVQSTSVGGGGGKGAIRLFAIPSCKLLCQLPFDTNELLADWRSEPLTLSADGRLIALITRRDRLIHVYDTATGKPYSHLAQGPGKQQAGITSEIDNGTLAFSHDGKLLASWTSWARKIRLWDLATGKEYVQQLRDDQSHQHIRFAFSPDGRMLAVGDQKIQLYEVASGRLRREFTGHEGDVRCLAFSPDGRLLASGSTDTTVLIWDVWGK